MLDRDTILTLIEMQDRKDLAEGRINPYKAKERPPYTGSQDRRFPGGSEWYPDTIPPTS